MTNSFLKKDVEYSDYVDAAFDVAYACKQDPQGLNCVLGSLFDEDNKLVAYNTVYNCLNEVDNRRKAKYADNIAGNNDFTSALYDWFNIDNNVKLNHRIIASPGGTGALNLAFRNILNEGETILIPAIGWVSYRIMAKQSNLPFVFYELFDQNSEVTLQDMFDKSQEIMNKQGKVMVLINDPAHNPTGISYGKDKWDEIIAFYNNLAKQGSVIILNDVAYIDYCHNSRAYMSAFNNIDENVLLLVAFSCSKTLTAYGARVGANIILSKNQQVCDETFNAFVRSVRGTWGSINNAMMDTLVKVFTEHKEEYLQERQQYLDLLFERAAIFKEHAKKYNLPLYPYDEGFFLTIKVDNPEEIHKQLIDRHIYTVKVNKGIRISICAINKETCQKLPALLAEVIHE